jgi:branched-chain amino acid transport system substrate-binding protein
MRQMNILRTAWIVVVCFFLILCSVSGASAQKKPAIKLGVNLDVTGYGAWLGEPELRALELYAEQVNSRGGIDGHPLELVVYDNESNPEKSSGNAKKLIQRDKVTAVIGPVLTATCNAAKSVAQDEKVVMYSLSASYDPSYADSYSFAPWVASSDQVETIYDHFAKKGIKRVATLCATDSTGQIWFDETNKSAKKYGLEIISERFNVKDVDVTPQLAKLKAGKPQALIVGVTGAPNAVVAKNFNQMGFKIPYVTSLGNMSDTFLKLIEGNEPETLLLPGAYYVVWKELPDAYPQKRLMKEFAEAFQKKFKKEPDIYAAVGYDVVRVTVEGMRQVKPEGPKDSPRLRDAMEKIKNFPAAYGGTYTFSKEDHRGTKKDACGIFQVKGGKFVMAK